MRVFRKYLLNKKFISKAKWKILEVNIHVLHISTHSTSPSAAYFDLFLPSPLIWCSNLTPPFPAVPLFRTPSLFRTQQYVYVLDVRSIS